MEIYDDERWQRVIDINLTGVFATMRAATRHMKPQRSGRIIVTTSHRGGEKRGGDRLGLHGREGRRRAPDA